jgi:hypothetical protein
MQLEYYILLPDHTNRRVLLQATPEGWSLPCFRFSQPHFWQEVGPLNEAVRQRFGVRVTTLNCVEIIDDEAAQASRFVYALENHDPDPSLRPDQCWLNAEALATLPVAWPEQQALVARWLAEDSARAQSVRRAPWYNRGWLEGAATWVQQELVQAGVAPQGDWAQVRSWERSSLWRIETTGGTLYFKAVPAMFSHEPPLSAWLGRWAPDRFAPVLAIEPAQGWLLMASAGQQGLNRVPNLDHWRAALQSFAQTQVELASQLEALFRLGVPDRRLDWLVTGAEKLLADRQALADGPTGLTDQEIVRLQRGGPALLAACEALAALGVPSSLEHGDFAPGQVLINGNDYTFLDWSDSGVAHPFFSFDFFADLIDEELPGVADAHDRLAAAYLEPWAALASHDTLHTALALAHRVAPLYQALIYSEHILPNMNAVWEMERMLPFFLRQVLARNEASQGG